MLCPRAAKFMAIIEIDTRFEIIWSIFRGYCKQAVTIFARERDLVDIRCTYTYVRAYIQMIYASLSRIRRRIGKLYKFETN